jgi:hypothetical protein
MSQFTESFQETFEELSADPSVTPDELAIAAQKCMNLIDQAFIASAVDYICLNYKTVGEESVKDGWTTFGKTILNMQRVMNDYIGSLTDEITAQVITRLAEGYDAPDPEYIAQAAAKRDQEMEDQASRLKDFILMMQGLGIEEPDEPEQEPLVA